MVLNEIEVGVAGGVVDVEADGVAEVAEQYLQPVENQGLQIQVIEQPVEFQEEVHHVLVDFIYITEEADEAELLGNGVLEI